MKKVLFYSPLSYTPHWEIELNLMEKYLRGGWQVVLLKCDAELPACLANPLHTYTRCLECRTRKDSGIKWIGKDRITVKSLYNLSPEERSKIEELKKIKIESLEQLKDLKIDGSDIGAAAMSSIMTNLRESNVDLEKYRQLLKNYVTTAAIAHFSATRHLSEEMPDEMVAFNGRIASVRPAMRAAWKLGITTYIHETGKVKDRYWLIKNNFLHSLSGKKSLVEQSFADSKSSFEEMKKLAAEWFEERRAKNSHNQMIFTGKQVDDRLPEDFFAEKTNVVIFNSSEYEFYGFDEFKNRFYENQNECVRKLLEDLGDKQNLQFYVRIHPNLTNEKSSQISGLFSLAEKFPQLKLINPDSPVDSYALLDACDIIVVFNSTVGIESVYAGKKPILMGRSIYEDLGGLIKPESHKELVEIIENYRISKTLPAVENADSAWVKFGYFMKQGGVELEFAKKDDWWRARMIRDGETEYIKPSYFSRILNMFFNRDEEQITD